MLAQEAAGESRLEAAPTKNRNGIAVSPRHLAESGRPELLMYDDGK